MVAKSSLEVEIGIMAQAAQQICKQPLPKVTLSDLKIKI